jgi:hypothetical protein
MGIALKQYLSDLKYLVLDTLNTPFSSDSLLIQVRLSSPNARYSQFIKEQTPGGLGVVGICKFGAPLFSDYDWVINGPSSAINYKRESSVLHHIEPPSYIQLLGLSEQKIVDKFSLIYTSDPYLLDLGDDRIIASCPFVHWHLSTNVYTGKIKQEEAFIGFDFLLNAPIPLKTENLVIINSNLRTLPGHILRANFIEKLCHTTIKFRLYGGSYWTKFNQYVNNAPNGKWPIFSTSKFVLVIENECAEYYWSEKFTDAILSYSIPIYYGCPNIHDYFPRGSYYPIDINSPSALDEIRELLASDYYEKNLNNLLKARDLVLHKLNLFSFIDSQIPKLS